MGMTGQHQVKTALAVEIEQLRPVRKQDGAASFPGQPVKARHIFIAAVLYAAIGVVDKSLPVGIGPRLRDGLFQSCQRVAGLESIRERPPDNLAGVGIGDQVQVADSILRHDVRDVGHPQLVGSRRAEAVLQEVPVLAVTYSPIPSFIRRPARIISGL